MLFFLRSEVLEEHASRHGVAPKDAEYVVRTAEQPFPEDIGEGKFRVWGRTRNGDYVQVIFALKELDEIAPDQLTLPMLASIWDEDALFVVIIHAMPMTDEMKRHYRKRAEP
jgi:hypothetical protein